MNLRGLIEKRVALMLSPAHSSFDETCTELEKAIEAKLSVVVEKEIKKITDRRVFSLANKLAREKELKATKPTPEAK